MKFLVKDSRQSKFLQKLPFLILGAVILAISLYYAFRDADIDLQEKKIVRIVLDGNPLVNNFSTSLKFYDDIRFTAKGYDRIFIIDNFEYKAASTQTILHDLKRGDEVTVWTDEEVNVNEMYRVYSMEFKGSMLIDIKARNNIQARYRKYSLVVSAYAIFLLFHIGNAKGSKLTFAQAVGILVLILIGMYRISK